MILEVSILDIKDGMSDEFEAAFKQAEKIISSMSGYISHELQKCIEVQNRYILLVHWETLEAHTIGFRKSAEYQEWKQLLHHFYDPFPVVEHYYSVF
ncbi:MAG: antibiotic biosynthesis monooxygenase [Cyanobacteria bacterium P01_A01_bin.80]